ncbi:hypothetical protein IWW52_002420 [Coemansia sp. RSA 2704]|nr:hypothetical protein IWW52_002420 [Coemansia sp. RSA 2704]
MELPDDVLKLILEKEQPVSLDQYSTPAAAIQQRLQWLIPAASVSRRWRSACEAQLYRTLLVQIDTDSAQMASNVALALANGKAGRARQLCICISGLAAIEPAELQRRLGEAGLLGTVWAGIGQLHVTQQSQELRRRDARALGRLNAQLAQALPGLQHVAFGDLLTRHTYGRVWLEPLLRQRQHALRSLRVFSDVLPRLRPSEPVAIQRLHIDGVTFRRPLRPGVLWLLADSLQELTLCSVPHDGVWELFASPPGAQELVFAQLRRLELVFYWESSLVPQARSIARADGDFEPESNTSSSDEDYGHGKGSGPGYMASTIYGRPRFPELRALEVRRFPGQLGQFLELFAGSPHLRRLVLAGLSDELPAAALDLAQFRPRLLALSVRVVGALQPADHTYAHALLGQVFATAELQQLSLSLWFARGRQSGFEFAPEYTQLAGALRTLRLVAPLGEAAVAGLLRQLPRLTDLALEELDPEPVPSVALLIQRLRGAPPAAPASTSLVRLSVLCAEGAGAAGHRGLLLRLVCALPRLYALRVAADAVAELRKAVRALVTSGVAAQQAAQLQGIRVAELEL